MFVRTFFSLLKFCAHSGLTRDTCCAKKQPRKAASDAPSALSFGAGLYENHCVACHGDDWKESGPFPRPYRVPPDLTTLSRRHAGKFPEYDVPRVLRNGVSLPAHRPAEMPAQGTEFEATSPSGKTQVESRMS
jgi:mono/diheme cytochrome c family protein